MITIKLQGSPAEIQELVRVIFAGAVGLTEIQLAELETRVEALNQIGNA